VSPKEREARINALTDSQATSIARLIKDTIVLTRLPKGYLDNIDGVDAVYELCRESDYGEIDKRVIEQYVNQATQEEVGKAAKGFLLFLVTVDDEDLIHQLDEELNKPPDELVAAIEPVSLLLVVFGGIALLNVISNIRFKNGKFEYDPERGKDASKQNINGVVRIIKAIIPFGSKDNSNS